MNPPIVGNMAANAAAFAAASQQQENQSTTLRSIKSRLSPTTIVSRQSRSADHTIVETNDTTIKEECKPSRESTGPALPSSSSSSPTQSSSANTTTGGDSLKLPLLSSTLQQQQELSFASLPSDQLLLKNMILMAGLNNGGYTSSSFGGDLLAPNPFSMMFASNSAAILAANYLHLQQRLAGAGNFVGGGAAGLLPTSSIGTSGSAFAALPSSTYAGGSIFDFGSAASLANSDTNSRTIDVKRECN